MLKLPGSQAWWWITPASDGVTDNIFRKCQICQAADVSSISSFREQDFSSSFHTFVLYLSLSHTTLSPSSLPLSLLFSSSLTLPHNSLSLSISLPFPWNRYPSQSPTWFTAVVSNWLSIPLDEWPSPPYLGYWVTKKQCILGDSQWTNVLFFHEKCKILN